MKEWAYFGEGIALLILILMAAMFGGVEGYRRGLADAAKPIPKAVKQER